jgi:CsoR family transcriptional regulator, copper-sensing transcriptional repressor
MKQRLNMNPNHTNNLPALRRIEGQVRGIQKMIEEKKYCIDILTQIQAIKGALSRVEEKILEKHFQYCVTDAMREAAEKEKKQKLDEILKMIRQTRKG